MPSQSTAGRRLEKYVIGVLTQHGFRHVTYAEWIGLTPNAKDRTVVSGHKYTSARGHKSSRMDLVAYIGNQPQCVIEVKAQNTSGSTSNKMVYAAIDLKHQQTWVGVPMLLIVGGALPTAGDGADSCSFRFAKRIADEGLALCRQVNGYWLPMTRNVNRVLWMNQMEFETWAWGRFNSPRKMVEQ